MRIYVASSWRNKHVTAVVAALRLNSHLVYDFREDDGQGAAFNWSDIDPNWQQWTPDEFSRKLYHPTASRGFERDYDALRRCDAVVLVMPCGRSAHLELGCAVGMRKPTCILLDTGEPELCYRMVDHLALDIPGVVAWASLEAGRHYPDKELFMNKPRPITKGGPGH